MRIKSVLVAAFLVLAPPPGPVSIGARSAQASFDFQPGAPLPLGAPVTGAAGPTTLGAVLEGKPALLLFVDYRCRCLCGVMLDELGDVLPKVELQLGKAYNVVTVALDEAQSRRDTDAFRDRHTAGLALAGAVSEQPDPRKVRHGTPRSFN